MRNKAKEEKSKFATVLQKLKALKYTRYALSASDTC
ncbi:MAG: hypothetical protein RLZ76_928 [Bacteroidota bacterium]|jgi:hypothetical protein